MKRLSLVILSTLFLLGSFGVASATLIDDSDDLFTVAHYNLTTPVPTSISTLEVGDVFSFSVYDLTISDSSVSVYFNSDWVASGGIKGPKVSGIEVPSLVGLLGTSSSEATYANGVLSFNLGRYLASGTTLTADFDFGSAVNTNPNVMHNPIPAPILLLGTGLIGMAGFRRKMKK